jgi:glycosyltransferase involved in cell wall biosynthesis
MPKISIVLPVYNGQQYLKTSIESVLGQTYKDFELIIVDDCSTDSTKEIAQYYTSLDARVSYYRNNVNSKLPISLNEGFSKTKGEFLTWTSCDNMYLLHAFEKMVSVLQDNTDIGLVYASMQVIDESNEEKDLIKSGPSGDLIFRNVVGACFLYRRSVAERVGSYNPSLFLCEDYEYWLRIARFSKIYPLEDCLYQYRRHSNSLSHKNEKEIIAKGIAVQKKYYSVFVRNRHQTANFYAHLRARDIYNPLRQLYLFVVLFYSPKKFFLEVYGLAKRRFD